MIFPKPQTVRILDVFVLAPAIYWAGSVARKKSPGMGTLVMAIGVLTAIYNGANYLRIEKEGG